MKLQEEFVHIFQKIRSELLNDTEKLQRTMLFYLILYVIQSRTVTVEYFMGNI